MQITTIGLDIAKAPGKAPRINECNFVPPTARADRGAGGGRFDAATLRAMAR